MKGPSLRDAGRACLFSFEHNFMIQKIFFFLILMILLPDVYIYFVYIRKWTKKACFRLTFFIPSILLLGGLFYLAFMATGKFVSANSQLIGWVTMAYLIVVIPKLIFSLVSLLDLPLKYLLRKPRQPFKYIGMAGALASIGIIAYGATAGKTAFIVNEVPVYASNIPAAFDNYRILQFSDVHIGSWKGNEKALGEAVEMINGLNADVTVFTGDLVNSRTDELDGFERILAGISGKDGVYSILGNHDYGTYYQWDSPEELTANFEELKMREKRMGWRMLNNEHVMLYRGNDSIALIGVENDGEPPFSQNGDLKKAMQGADAPFKVLLSHNPTHWRREVLSTDIDLMLAGHTHAMQMAWGHHSPASFKYPEWGGMYKEGHQMLYVNIGLGFIGLPMRIGARPEITVFTLHPEP